MNIISIDLGTTNIKTAIYDNNLRCIDIFSEPVNYDRAGKNVEFDPLQYFNIIHDLIVRAGSAGKRSNGENVGEIVLTGQAESLILLDSNRLPARPGISWLDMRSSEECEELTKKFPKDSSYLITGQPELIPTWPITKILWVKKNEKEIFHNVRYILLLKDYIIYRLCGSLIGDYSIYSFSYYFDIQKKCYWKDILDYCGVDISMLPTPAPSGTIAGNLSEALQCENAGLTAATKINIGTLDHFAGMIGTGSIREGQVSESAGTVLSIAVITPNPVFEGGNIPNYCGPFPDSYVLLPVFESGGFSMEWYKKEFLKDVNYNELNKEIENRKNAGTNPPIFLPYLTGVNPPEFGRNASGVFFGLHAEHDRFDMAYSVMQGVACVLRKNLDYLENSGVKIEKIISTGGGAKSSVWTQIKADITGRPIIIPENEEAPCLGAAIMATVSEGIYHSYEEAITACVSVKQIFDTHKNKQSELIYTLHCKVYTALEQAFQTNILRDK